MVNRGSSIDGEIADGNTDVWYVDSERADAVLATVSADVQDYDVDIRTSPERADDANVAQGHGTSSLPSAVNVVDTNEHSVGAANVQSVTTVEITNNSGEAGSFIGKIDRHDPGSNTGTDEFLSNGTGDRGVAYVDGRVVTSHDAAYGSEEREIDFSRSSWLAYTDTFYYTSIYEGTIKYVTATTGSGTVVFGNGGMQCNTGATSGSIAEGRPLMAQVPVDLTWERDRVVIFKVNIQDSATGRIDYHGTGLADGGPGVFFKLENGDIKGASIDSVGTETTTSAIRSGISTGVYKCKIEFDTTDGEEVAEFYFEDGTDPFPESPSATIDTALPTGTDQATRMIQHYVENTVAEERRSISGGYRFVQGPGALM